MNFSIKSVMMTLHVKITLAITTMAFKKINTSVTKMQNYRKFCHRAAYIVLQQEASNASKLKALHSEIIERTRKIFTKHLSQLRDGDVI
jgi:hypothetical protein